MSTTHTCARKHTHKQVSAEGFQRGFSQVRSACQELELCVRALETQSVTTQSRGVRNELGVFVGHATTF